MRQRIRAAGFATAILVGFQLPAFAGSAPAKPQPLNDRLVGDIIPTHDPVLIREGYRYYVFSTGGGVTVKSSPDLVNWTAEPQLLGELPDWVQEAVPGAEGIWAPDIAHVNGEYRLYYSVSTFGSNRSAIGLATSPTLDRGAADYGWTDRGIVVRSMPSDDFNAIDANFIEDAEGGQWLSLGSFWSGIKLFPLDPATGKLKPGAKPLSIAQRAAPAGAPAPVEAPFIFRHGGWYFLLVSYDYCCKGRNSTYYTVVGRSKAVTGPYLGRDGSKLMEGGGTILLRADLQEKERYRGPGHAGVFTDEDGTTYVVYHAYDSEKKGAPTLRIAPLSWDDEGWPTAVR